RDHRRTAEPPGGAGGRPALGQPDGAPPAGTGGPGVKLTPELRDRTFRWIADDLDPRARTELQQVLAQAMGGSEEAVAELTDRMAGPLTFGTAGLRGPVRAGPNGMNRAVVVRTTAGVA